MRQCADDDVQNDTTKATRAHLYTGNVIEEKEEEEEAKSAFQEN